MANGKTEQEYYGYKPPKPFDWVTASQAGLKQVEGVIAGRVKEREDNEKTRRETSKTLERLEQGQNKDFNEIVTEGSFASKDWAYDLTQKLYNNEINSQQFRQSMNNLQDGWNNFSDISKGFNEKLQLFADRQQEDISSIVENGNAKNFSLMADFKNKKIEIGPNGKVYWSMLDENGDIIPGQTQSMTALNTTPQQLHDKVNVSEEVNEHTKLIGTFKEAIRAGKIQDTTGIVAMEDFEGLDGYSEYENMVKNIQGQILGGPGGMNNAASVLGDNSLGGNNQTYFTYQEDEVETDANGDLVFKSTSEHAGKPLELGIKLVKNDNGVLTAELTDDQMEIAKDIIENTARQQIGLEQKSIPFFQSKPADQNLKNRKQAAATNYHAAIGASTLNDLSEIEGASPDDNTVIENVRWDGGNLVYDLRNTEDNTVQRNLSRNLERLTTADAKAFTIFGLITGLKGDKLRQEYDLAKKSLSKTQKDDVDKWIKTPGEFVVAEFTPLSKMSKITVRDAVEKVQGTELKSVSIGEASPMEHLKVLSARIKSGKSINTAYKKDFVNFVKQIARTGGGGEIQGLTVGSPTKTGDVVTIEVSTAASEDDKPYIITISGDPTASAKSIEEQLKLIIKDDYIMRDV